jgi:hypothetical protein
MNYAIAFLGLITLACSLHWYISGRKFYTGPLIEAMIDDTSEMGNVSGSDQKGEEKV